MSFNEIITIKDFSFRYGSNLVLKNLDLSIEKGTVHGILGDNGAGKTTLFDSIFNNSKFPNNINIPLNLRKSIAYLEAESFFYSYMTGKEYLEIISKNNIEQFNKWNELFELPLNDYVTSYSTGMKKKLAILGVFLLQKDILILDEPFNGLDFKSVETINYTIQKFKGNGKTLLLSSHILETLTKNSDKISILENGGILRTFRREEFHQLDVLISTKFRDNISNIVSTLIK